MKIKTATKLSSYLGVSGCTVNRWMHKGLPCELDGMTYIYDLEDVLRWLVQRSPRHRRMVEALRDRQAAGES